MSCGTRRTPTRGCDSKERRALLRRLAIEPNIAMRETPDVSGLGKVRGL
jgi:hypothetical protein